MAFPEFHWNGNKYGPEGLASFKAGTKNMTFVCYSFGYATDLWKVINAAYESGRSDGEEIVAERVKRALHK